MVATATRQEQSNQINAARRARERDLEIPDVADPARRARLEADDAEWMAFYLGDVFFNPFTPDQLATIHDVGQVLEYGTLGCKAAERGDGKSSIVKYLMLKYALQHRLWFPLVIAATGPKAQKTTASIRRRLASKSPTPQELEELAKRKANRGDRLGVVKGKPITPNFLAADYPLECHVARYVNPWPSRARNVTANGQRPIHVEWGSADGYFILPTFADEIPLGPIWMSIGWTSDELQGCNIYDRRPDAIMLDDLDSRDSLAAADGKIAGKIEECIETTIAGLGGQAGGLGQYFLCTVASEISAAAKYSDPKQKPAWNGKRVPAIKRWPVGEAETLWGRYVHLWKKGKEEGDQFCREAHRLYLDNRAVMDDADVSNPYRYDKTVCPDGSQMEVSSLQRCYNFIAKHGRAAFDTEYQQDPPKIDSLFETSLTAYRVTACEGEYSRGVVDEGTEIVVRGVDVRKIELHHACLSSSPVRLHRIPDYGVESHGTTETTVENAEFQILDGLNATADKWAHEPLTDEHGTQYSVALTLIDKGWLGSWTEDGQKKTWATQPVETFCVARGLRQWLPAKGQPAYRSPAPAKNVIIGNHWHINCGPGAERKCHEVIWDAEHWHSLVEDLFTTDDADQRFELFHAPERSRDEYANHRRFSEHIRSGAEDLADMRKRASRTKKPKFRHDHWWDSVAMALVAKSVEEQFRLMESRRKPTKPVNSTNPYARGGHSFVATQR